MLLGQGFYLRFRLNRHQYSCQTPCLGLHNMSGVPVDTVVYKSTLENKADSIPRPVGAADMAWLVMKIRLHLELRSCGKVLAVRIADGRKLQNRVCVRLDE